MLLNYEDIIKRYGRPLDVALALKIVTPKSSYIKKQRASSRICMWKLQNPPKRWLDKLNELERIEEEKNEKMLKVQDGKA